MYLFTDDIEHAGNVPILQLHVHRVAEQSQAPSGPQHPISFQEELRAVEPVSRRHGCHEIHLTRSKR